MWFFKMFQNQTIALWIIFNFDSSYSLFEVIGDNLRKTFLEGHSAYTHMQQYFQQFDNSIKKVKLLASNLLKIMKWFYI